ncbi:MAG: phenylalanine--tRNA ligase subunit beta, partial [Candidatus Omnitrophica bacterium]|nr:phenylalanine--tRNA ligase subunit beta [Candidatus Omnitrophota bacterium]
MRVSLNWLKDFIDIKGGLEKVRDSLTMAGLEVSSVIDIEGDSVMDIEITPNRPDCLSILGVARELASATAGTLKIQASIKKSYMKKAAGHGAAKIDVVDKRGCPRYVGCIIKNAKIGPSPKWLIERLNAMGVRAVNNVVDITNYVLFETGQPLHAFDLDKLDGNKIIVRRAKKGESIITIDGVKRDLEPDTLVIADGKSPVAIAGIMGGKATEITNETKNIFLESAYFDPISVRRSQRKLTLASESSYRFERGVDLGMVLSASARAQELIKDLAGGKAKGTVTDVGGRTIKEKEISLNLTEIPRVLGVDIKSNVVMDFFKRLELKPVKSGKNKISVKVPSYRQDLDTETDLIEEVARLYGYDKMPSKDPVFSAQKYYEQEKKEQVSFEKNAKRILCSLGLNEVLTYTLTSRSAIEAMGISFDKALRLANPMSSNQEFMRPSLLPEMLEVVSWNLSKNNLLLKLFELNKVYMIDKASGNVREKNNLSIGVCGVTEGNWKEKAREIDFFDLKGIVQCFLDESGVKDYVIKEGADFASLRNELSASIKIAGETIGMLGEIKSEVAKKFDIKQKVYLAELDVESLLKHA